MKWKRRSSSKELASLEKHDERRRIVGSRISTPMFTAATATAAAATVQKARNAAEA
jgi:hypothetical protein